MTTISAQETVQRGLILVNPDLESPEQISCKDQLESLLDAVLKRKSPKSDKPALLFLLLYKKFNSEWKLSRVPAGWRPADKIMCAGLTDFNLTLHGNITAYGENMGTHHVG